MLILIVGARLSVCWNWCKRHLCLERRSCSGLVIDILGLMGIAADCDVYVPPLFY
jgi:hypothetical protein